MQKNNALYYPFSRCLDDTTLKQNLLIFDSITFLDPVDDEDWRKELFRDLEDRYEGYRAYRDIAQMMPWLRKNKIVRIVQPEKLHSLQSDLTTAAALSDLGDKTWVGSANPQHYQLPMEYSYEAEQPVWNVFSDKMPKKFMEALSNETLLEPHLLYEGGDDFAWQLSYAAGSAIGINVHLAAAEELGLSPVTDSRLHHNLLLMKLARKVSGKSSSLNISEYVDHLSRNAINNIIKEILPKKKLESISIEEIIYFRERTEHARFSFLNEIKNDVISSIDLKPDNNVFIEESVRSKIAAQMKAYGDDLAATRDRIWSRVIDGATSQVPVATTAAGLAGSFISGSGYVLGASILLHALQPLKMVLDWSADLKKIKRSASGAVAYLSQVKDLS